MHKYLQFHDKQLIISVYTKTPLNIHSIVHQALIIKITKIVPKQFLKLKYKILY